MFPKISLAMVFACGILSGMTTTSTTAITIDRSTKNYADLLDVLDHLKDELGSATNAAVQCIKDSHRFQSAKAELDRQNELKNPKPIASIAQATRRTAPVSGD